MCADDPSKLQQILMSLQQQSPEMMELIGQNQEEFRQIIQSPVDENDMRAYQDYMAKLTGGEGQHQTGSSSHPQQGRDGAVRVNQTDYAAIGRLKELGFNEADAAQAYFAYEKNEDNAAMFLLENKFKEQENELNIDYSQVGGAFQQQPQQNQPQQGGQENQPQQGGQENQPQQGGQENQPQQGGQENQPQQGGQENQSQQSGQVNQPQQGGQENQPQQGGQENQPQQGGQENQSQQGGQNNENSNN